MAKQSAHHGTIHRTAPHLSAFGCDLVSSTTVATYSFNEGILSDGTAGSVLADDFATGASTFVRAPG